MVRNMNIRVAGSKPEASPLKEREERRHSLLYPSNRDARRERENGILDLDRGPRVLLTLTHSLSLYTVYLYLLSLPSLVFPRKTGGLVFSPPPLCMNPQPSAGRSLSPSYLIREKEERGRIAPFAPRSGNSSHK